MQSFVPLQNCPDANEMVDHLQVSLENARGSLSRQLHDEMGGLLVSAVMDVAFAEQNMPIDDQLRVRLGRVRRTLAEAIDLKRKIIESLRPSLLDNFGLFAALKWEVKHACHGANLAYSETYPDVEPDFTKEASISLFRIAQGSFSVALRQPSVTAARLSLDVDGDVLNIAVCHDGATCVKTFAQDDAIAICSIAHRVHALGGEMAVTGIDGGGARYSARFPLAQLITATAR
jgi:signal transduction histidine kinase